MTHATPPLHQAVTIEHGMNGALGGNRNPGEPADHALADLPSTPAGMLSLHIQDVVLYLKRKLVGVAEGTPATVGKPLKAAFLITIEDLIAGLARDAKLPAEIRHRFAGEPTSDKLQAFIHDRTLLPRHQPLPSKREEV